jgi:nitroimidazol reductase NimA-like FMN-containing flavoprotein (pyridoxamine 5'-phosphate oxidase superfamily)
MRAFLDVSAHGVLCLAPKGRPFANSNLFVRDPDEDAVYVHSAAQGALPSIVTTAVPALLVVTRIGRILPARRALAFSVEYASVHLDGTLAPVDDPAAARHGLGLLMKKYAPHLEEGRDFEGVTDADLRRTRVYRLAVERWTAKRNQAPEHPSAYAFGDWPAGPGEIPEREEP